MRFNTHTNYEGRHSLLSASKNAWANYDESQIDKMFDVANAAVVGSRLHDLAKNMILLGVKAEDVEKTFNMYVNDAIGYRMTPEVMLFVNKWAFGTADAISFRDGKLRIHDLKTGITPTSKLQLQIYAAYFCIEYGVKPFDIEIFLCIYQNDQVINYPYDPHTIMSLIDKIQTWSKRFMLMEKEAYL